MPANVQNARYFKLTTDFPLDKVIFLNSGSATVPFPTAGFTVVIPHGLPFTPLVGGSWDITSTFNTNYDYFTGTVPSSNPLATVFNIELDIEADATNITITPINVSGAPVTVYYRIFALEPSDSHADIPFTASAGSNFILNTDNNYTKLYLEDFINSPAIPSTTTVTHNLGYAPQVMAWYTFASGARLPVALTQVFGSDVSEVAVQVNNSTVNFIVGSLSFNVTRIDYRIYLDETG